MKPWSSLPQKGFTLLEILVVISIIALSTGLIVVSLSPNNNQRDLRKEAQEITKLFTLIFDEAIFKNKDIGIKVEPDKLSFMEKDRQTGLWQALSASQGNQYKDYNFSAFVEVNLEMEDVEVFLNPQQLDEFEQKISSIDPLENFEQFEEEEDEQLEPDIYIFSSGEMTAFDLELYTDATDTYRYIVSGNDFGVFRCHMKTDENMSC